MTAPAVELKDVSLAFRGARVLEEVCLRVHPGDFLAIIGPNGGGKSVLLRVIAGLLKPDGGEVRIFGMSPAGARGRIAYVPQYPQFELDYPIRAIDVVLMGRLHQTGLLRRYPKPDRDRAMDALERMGAADLAERQVGKLSGGQLQRVLIARALVVEAPLLLLDEPTASLDARIVSDFYARLAELPGDRAIILISHDIGVISAHVKTVACLNRRLHYHHSKEIAREVVEDTYGCSLDFITHGHTHLVLPDHSGVDAT